MDMRDTQDNCQTVTSANCRLIDALNPYRPCYVRLSRSGIENDFPGEAGAARRRCSF